MRFFLIILCAITEIMSFRKILFKTNIITPVIYTKQYADTIEHVFPKSLSKAHSNDLHNLFICNGKINNIRSNYKFTNESDILTDNNWIKLEENNYVNNKKRLFIPNNESKGIVARAIMYMSYNHDYNYKQIINYNHLINWSIDHPPTKEEYNHNELAFQCQKKRNKFIDLYDNKKYKSEITNIFK